jgi:hypothetical protein
MIFSAWSGTDPAAAVKRMAESLLRSDQEVDLMVGLDRWIQLDGQAAAQWLRELPDNGRRHQLIRDSLSSFASSSPELGYAVIQTLPPSDDRKQASGRLATGWAERDTPAAFKWAVALPEGTDRQAVLSELLPRVAEWNLSAATSFLSTNANSRGGEELCAPVAQRYAAENPQAALEWAKAIPAGGTRETALRIVVMEIASKSPAEGSKLARELFGPENRSTAFYTIARTWAKSDPKAAADFAASLQGTEGREQYLRAVITQWAQADYRAAANWVLNAMPTTQADSARYLTQALLGSNPTAAGELVQKLPPSDQTSALAETVVEAWTRYDPDKAVAWVEALPESPGRTRAFERLARQLAVSAPPRAAAFAVKAGADDMAVGLRRDIAVHWSESDPAAAADWAAKFATNRHDKALPAVATEWAKRAPADAAQFALRLEHREQETMLLQVLRVWANDSPQGAGNWLASNAPVKVATGQIRPVISRWTRNDAKGAANWVRSLPPGDLRDAAGTGLADNTRVKDISLTVAQAVGLISNAETRTRAMERLAKHWLERAPEAAKAWLATNSLPKASKKLLLEESEGQAQPGTKAAPRPDFPKNEPQRKGAEKLRPPSSD